MAWSASKIFAFSVMNALDRTEAFDLDTDSFKAALYNNTITPDNTVTAANTAYNVGQWATAQEVFQAGQWAQAGVALASNDVTIVSSTVVTLDANDTASGSAATLTNAYGALVYDDTMTTPVADQGWCYNYFGGANSVTAGTFTVVWATAGIATITV